MFLTLWKKFPNAFDVERRPVISILCMTDVFLFLVSLQPKRMLVLWSVNLLCVYLIYPTDSQETITCIVCHT